jgi:hypothetical protein
MLERLQKRLNHAENHRDDKDKGCDPESVPLHFLSVILPSLLDGLRLRIIVYLFQYDQAVSPVLETIDMTLSTGQVPARSSFGV